MCPHDVYGSLKLPFSHLFLEQGQMLLQQHLETHIFFSAIHSFGDSCLFALSFAWRPLAVADSVDSVFAMAAYQLIGFRQFNTRLNLNLITVITIVVSSWTVSLLRFIFLSFTFPFFHRLSLLFSKEHRHQLFFRTLSWRRSLQQSTPKVTATGDAAQLSPLFICVRRQRSISRAELACLHSQKNRIVFCFVCSSELSEREFADSQSL